MHEVLYIQMEFCTRTLHEVINEVMLGTIAAVECLWLQVPRSLLQSTES